MNSLALSFELAACVAGLLLLIGTPVAYWLAYSHWRGKFLLESIVALPLVLPPTVVGFYALLAMGPRGPLGKMWMALFGHGLAFTFGGLVVASVVYSFPFGVQPLIASFEAVDTMDREVNSLRLVACIQKKRREDASFILDVSLDAPPGITILFGPSGAGKSTLLDCLSGLLRPDAGKIAVCEKVLFDSALGINVPPQKRRIAYVFQSLALFPHLTVEQNIAYGLRDIPDQDRRRRMEEILEAFGVENLRKRKPAQISGGERQRTALARSLVTEPRLLLLDEPLTGLDAERKAAIVEDLRAWNASKRIPILYVTHNREEVDALGERVIAIDKGRVVGHGAPMEVLDAPRRERLAQAAGFENLLDAPVVDLRVQDGVVRLMLVESACEIEVPLAHASAGDRVQVAIRAGDILLASEGPRGLSARNVIEGRMASLEQRGTLCIARVDCGVTFVVHLTPGAVRSLKLAAEKPVWLVLKTHSCYLVD